MSMMSWIVRARRLCKALHSLMNGHHGHGLASWVPQNHKPSSDPAEARCVGCLSSWNTTNICITALHPDCMRILLFFPSSRVWTCGQEPVKTNTFQNGAHTYFGKRILLYTMDEKLSQIDAHQTKILPFFLNFLLSSKLSSGNSYY